MIVEPLPTPAIVLPENAPFAPEQRAWLSGFFSAVLANAPTPGVAALSPGEAAALAPATPVLASNDDAPWHDPAMAMGERMQLADGKPYAPRLMAAMAQQDCGQCGYSCADYANALFEGKEARWNLCAPGGKETLRKLKEIETAHAAEAGTAPTVPAEAKAASSDAAAPANPGRSREHPVEAAFLSRRRLNSEKSAKATYHVEIGLADSGLDYVVGDSLGILPENDLGLVDQVIATLGASPVTEVGGRTLRDLLTVERSLGGAPDSLFELFSYVCGGDARNRARALARGEDPDGDAATLDVLGAIRKFASARPHAEAFVEALELLQPRLYSISSSHNATPGRVSLTVDAVRYVVGKRQRLGVASTFLGERTQAGRAMKIYVQKAHGFALPADPLRPIIMVGPGTGVAPFRAFLHDRAATGAKGKNWLFFGHQHFEHDFFYRDEFSAMQASGHLARLSLAWSRDGNEKFYVQDRMRETGADIWRWLAEGAHVYVCGDAKRMAKDVEAAMVDIAVKHGMRDIDEAVSFVRGLKKTGRYQADVY